MDSQSTTRQTKRRGFNLIEAAIVLGVVGLVIGGIWVAASAVMENYKVNKTAEGIFTIAANTQNLISFSDAAIIPYVSYMTDTLIAAGAFPSNWVKNSNSIISPIGHFTVQNNTTYFIIRIHTKSPVLCNKLLVKVSSIGSISGSASNKSSLRMMAVSASPVIYFWSFPISPAVAESACNNSFTALEVGFNYTRNNN